MSKNLIIFFLKILSLMFFIVIVLGLSNAKCQGFNSAASWYHVEYGNRIAALGQASSALDNRIAFHVNPAIPVRPGTLNLSSFLLSSEPVQTLGFFDQPLLYNPSASIGFNKWTIGIKMDYTQWGSVPATDETGKDLAKSLRNDTRILRFNVSRELFENFTLGVSISHIQDYRDIEFRQTTQEGVDTNSLMFSAGIYYNYTFELSALALKPQIGLALTDVGGELRYNSDLENTATLTTPGQLRSSVGLDFISQKKVMDHHFIQLGLYLGLNKYMSGIMRFNSQDNSYSLITGLDMLTSTWSSFDRFDGTGITQIDLFDQISSSFGIELGLMETLYFQFGTIGGADRWIRPQKNYGVTLDLFYISLSYTDFNYKSSEQWAFNDWSTPVWSLDIRIPFDGASHNTLLESFIQWMKN